jgi:hydrogenase maturation factor
MFGWYTVHIGASDVAVMGVPPRYMTYSLLMPPETEDRALRAIVDSIHDAALDLGIAIVGGHTGYYPGFAAPTIGGVTVLAIADRDAYVTPAGARPGDAVILTKGPAIETAGILSVVREGELLGRYPEPLVRKGQALCRQMTVVRDALTAMAAGGVTAMHDATEGGVIGGLAEVAEASGVGMAVDEARFVYPEEVRMVCEAFGIDPVAAIAEGSLIITSGAGHAARILGNLGKAGIAASVIGKVTADTGNRVMKRRNGTEAPLRMPAQDPFWPVFFEGMK